MINPFIKNKRLLLIYLIIWFSIFLLHTFILNWFLSISLYSSFIDSLTFNLLYLFLGLSVWYTVNFSSLDISSISKIFINHIASAAIISGFWILTGFYITKNISADDKSYLIFLNKSLLWRFIIGIMYYSILVAIDYVIIYYNNFQEKLLKEAELKTLIKEAELKSLKYQINPHFIFNCLNSISALTISSPSKAQEMTIKLSTFLRNTLSKNENQKNKLSDEISYSKLYLDIEKIRFGDKFDFIEEVEQECYNIEIPSMILQPLFENAIKHGVYESLKKVTIKLKCKKINEYLKIIVENNFDTDSVPKKGEGIGLKNIQNRLKLIYNQDNLFKAEKFNNIFSVNIFIPV